MLRLQPPNSNSPSHDDRPKRTSYRAPFIPVGMMKGKTCPCWYFWLSDNLRWRSTIQGENFDGWKQLHSYTTTLFVWIESFPKGLGDNTRWFWKDCFGANARFCLFKKKYAYLTHLDISNDHCNKKHIVNILTWGSFPNLRIRLSSLILIPLTIWKMVNLCSLMEQKDLNLWRCSAAAKSGNVKVLPMNIGHFSKCCI